MSRPLGLGLALAGCVWTAAFRGRSGFWQRMTAGVGTLGTLALLTTPELRSPEQRPRRSDVVVGIGTAAALYGIFRIGDRMARRIMPRGGEEIAEVYQRRLQASRGFIVPALVLVIAPGEELFWRGMVNGHLMQRLGPVRGAAAGSAVYGGIHLVSGNLTLTGAAGVAGAFWSAQYLVHRRLAPLIISHALWDVWIFLVQPTVQVD